MFPGRHTCSLFRSDYRAPPTLLFTLPPTIFAFFHALKYVETLFVALGRTAWAARVKALGQRDKDGYRMAAKLELGGVLALLLNIFSGFGVFFVFFFFSLFFSLSY